MSPDCTRKIARSTMIGLAAGLALLAISFVPRVADAAPQALALVATSSPIQLACAGDKCSAEFTTYCLQPERHAPVRGTNYFLTEKSRIALTAIDRNGKAIALSPHKDLRFQSLRSHSAVSISLAPGLVQRLGLKSVSLALANNITLTPEAEQGDDNPITADELALVETELRPVGNYVVDRNSTGMAAAHVTNRLVNYLPKVEDNAHATAVHWRGLMAQARDDGLSPDAAHLAQNAFDLCRFYANQSVQGDMRYCMQGQHDRLMKVLNSDYWKAVKTGS